MTLSLPILGREIRGAVFDGIANFPDAFPPRRTAVPQPGDTNGDATGDAGRHAIMGFFTDTSICIGCKACEVACKQWNQLPSDGMKLTGHSYDNTGHLSGTTWRHVAFKEKLAASPTDPQLPEGQVKPEEITRLLMMSDVCKHCESAPCEHSCPTGAIIYNQFGDVYVQNDICNGCGYCVSACPFGVLGRSDKKPAVGKPDPVTSIGTKSGLGSAGVDSKAQRPQGDGRAHKCTLCMDRQVEGLVPACAKSCPTASIQFGPVSELRERAKARVETLHERGNQSAYLYGCDSVGDYGPLNSFFLLEDHPNEYNLPEAPKQPFRGQEKRYAMSLGVGAVLTAAAALLFRAHSGGGRHGR